MLCKYVYAWGKILHQRSVFILLTKCSTFFPWLRPAIDKLKRDHKDKQNYDNIFCFCWRDRIQMLVVGHRTFKKCIIFPPSLVSKYKQCILVIDWGVQIDVPCRIPGDSNWEKVNDNSMMTSTKAFGWGKKRSMDTLYL